MVVRLAQSEWLRFIQSLPGNSYILGPTSDLDRFLFGSERMALTRMAIPLAERSNTVCVFTANVEYPRARSITSYPGLVIRAIWRTTWFWRTGRAIKKRAIC
jgi:hypothetical protein